MSDTTKDAVPLSDAEIKACALMIKGICMTRPQEEWSSNIESRIRFMLSRSPAQVQAESVQVPWIVVGESWPKAEWDKYYQDDFSAPVAVMIDYNGHVRRSEVTWRYSFAHGGWVHADLREGWKPGDYEDCGRVTHWAPLPEPLTAPSTGDQS